MNKLIEFLLLSGIDFEENVPGSRLCSFRVGGDVRILAKPSNPKQIKGLIDFLNEEGIARVLLGRGSNVVISDEGFDGVVITLQNLNGIDIKGKNVRVGAGVSLRKLASEAQKNGLCGIEFAHGIPGSVGGGVYMNAGAYGGEICQILTDCECLDIETGEVLYLNNFDCGFSYRHSIFQEKKNLFVLSASFELEEGDPESILSKMEELRIARFSKQPIEYPSAGSTFKRPEGNFAGKLIEDAGLKGYAVGGAEVSTKHAGFIINRYSATAKDVKELVEYVKNTVNEKFGVMLKEEIEFI